MLDGKKLKEYHKQGLSGGIINCLEMGLLFLKNETDITKFTPKMLDDFIDTIVEIWKPEGNDKAKKDKEKTVMVLKAILPELIKKMEDYIVKEGGKAKSTYENSKWIFQEWEEKIQKHIRGNLDLRLQNPFLQVSIEKNLRGGKKFAEHQVQTRRAVTTWGGIFEKCFSIFASDVKSFNAGRMDVKVNKILYDIKSGPNVLNLRDVDGVNKKIELVSTLKERSFGEFIEVTCYKVAIIYGRWELRNVFMKKIIKDGLIIGPDTWKEITGDGWNAFKFFIWQIRFQVEELKKEWTIKDLGDAVSIFLDSFYGNQQNVQKATGDPEYKKLKKLIEKIK